MSLRKMVQIPVIGTMRDIFRNHPNSLCISFALGHVFFSIFLEPPQWHNLSTERAIKLQWSNFHCPEIKRGTESDGFQNNDEMHQQGTVPQGLHSIQMYVKQSNFMGCISNSSTEVIKIILTHTSARKSIRRKKTQKLSSSNIKKCELTKWI